MFVFGGAAYVQIFGTSSNLMRAMVVLGMKFGAKMCLMVAFGVFQLTAQFMLCCNPDNYKAARRPQLVYYAMVPQRPQSMYSVV